MLFNVFRTMETRPSTWQGDKKRCRKPRRNTTPMLLSISEEALCSSCLNQKDKESWPALRRTGRRFMTSTRVSLLSLTLHPRRTGRSAWKLRWSNLKETLNPLRGTKLSILPTEILDLFLCAYLFCKKTLKGTKWANKEKTV